MTTKLLSFNPTEQKLITDSIHTQIKTLSKFAKKENGLAGIAHEVIQELDDLIHRIETNN